jgi:branched-subunit amino acid aminotransferase/4-amino-4-deoxychorismate lyase
MAAARDLHHLIMATPDGKIIADAAEPLFIVKGHKVTLPVVAMPSVEQTLIERASISLGFEVEQKQLTVEMLQDAEEVAIASWQGITAINHIDSKPYMSIIAERIVAQMEHREKKQ